jgi:hypothetical protein
MCKAEKPFTAIHLPLPGNFHVAPMIRRLMQMILNEILIFEAVFDRSELVNALFVSPYSSCSIVFRSVSNAM